MPLPPITTILTVSISPTETHISVPNIQTRSLNESISQLSGEADNGLFYAAQLVSDFKVQAEKQARL